MNKSILAMNHSARYENELDGSDTQYAADLGKRTAALIRAGKLTGNEINAAYAKDGFNGIKSLIFEAEYTVLEIAALCAMVDEDQPRPEPLVTGRHACDPSCPLTQEPGDNLTAGESAGFGQMGPY